MLSMRGGGQQTLLSFFQRTKASNGFVICIVRRASFGHELLGTQGEMQSNFFFDFALPVIAPAERERQGATDAESNHEPLALPGSVAAVRMSVTVPAYSTQVLVSARRCARPAAVAL